jgi:hypothetical protein
MFYETLDNAIRLPVAAIYRRDDPPRLRPPQSGPHLSRMGD